MLDIKFSQFFDKSAVIDKLSAAKRASLSKAGAFVRRTAKGLIRSGKKPQKTPGKPPKSHLGLLKELIFFAYDFAKESVVIGPTLSNSGRRRVRRGRASPPELLEFGGQSVTDKGKPATYRKFPYMAPALEKEKDKFADLFAGSVK